jgi:hypothetical protein
VNDWATRGQRSIAIDSNVWRYMIDSNGVDTVRQAAKLANVDIVILPAILYETLRMGDSRTKRDLIDVQTRQVWRRVMPEAFTEAEELRRAISALRPHWLVDRPDLRFWRRLYADWDHDWKEGTWSRARRDPQGMAKLIGGSGRLAPAREEAQRARDTAIELGLSFGKLRIEKVESWFEEPVPGWNGERFATWRLEGLNAWLPTVAGKQKGAYADWLLPWIVPGLLRTEWASWVRFWTQDISEAEMPCHWLRTAMRIAASTRRTSPGTPVDVQISTYLYDVDAFCTSDSIFVDCIEKVRTAAPRSLAATFLLRGNESAVDDLVTVIESFGS